MKNELCTLHAKSTTSPTMMPIYTVHLEGNSLWSFVPLNHGIARDNMPASATTAGRQAGTTVGPSKRDRLDPFSMLDYGTRQRRTRVTTSNDNAIIGKPLSVSVSFFFFLSLSCRDGTTLRSFGTDTICSFCHSCRAGDRVLKKEIRYRGCGIIRNFLHIHTDVARNRPITRNCVYHI